MKRTLAHRLTPFLIALAASSAALAQGPDVGGGRIYSLEPEEKARLLDSATESSAESARAGLPGGGGGVGQIHGEIGAMIGTGGARGAYGVAAIPLGERAGAVVSFESSQFGQSPRRR